MDISQEPDAEPPEGLAVTWSSSSGCSSLNEDARSEAGSAPLHAEPAAAVPASSPAGGAPLHAEPPLLHDEPVATAPGSWHAGDPLQRTQSIAAGPLVLISHGGADNHLVSRIQERLQAKLQDRLPDEQEQHHVATWQPCDTGATNVHHSLGLVILSKKFLHNHHCMAQLHALLQRCQRPAGGLDAYAARDQPGPRLLVVLNGVTEGQLKAMRAEYKSAEAGWATGNMPSDAELDKWAADMLEATSHSLIQSHTWQVPGQLEDLTVLRAVELLEAAEYIPKAKSAKEQDYQGWEKWAEELVPGFKTGDKLTAIDSRSKRPDVFISHAGQQKTKVVDVLCKEFREKYPSIKVYLAENSVTPGSRSLLDIGQACRTTTVGMMLLSPDFVRKKYCMAELSILLRLWKHNRVLLLPVLYGGLTVEDLGNMRQLYASQQWCGAEGMPDAKTLDGWAADLGALTEVAIIRCDQWDGEDELVELTAKKVVEQLTIVEKRPSCLAMHNNATPPPAVEMVGRQGELQQALHALDRWRYVEIQGPPGEGKSTLAQHAVQALCGQWQALPNAQAAGEAVYALEVDLRGVAGSSRDLKSEVAASILAVVGVPPPPEGTQWPALLRWLQAVARVALLLENAEEVVLVEGLQPLLNQLLAVPTVHIIVATRVAYPGPDAVPLDSVVVDLQPLSEADGMRLVEARLGPGHTWAPDNVDREAARQLVALVQGSPLVLSIVVGLVRMQDLHWQDVLRRAQTQEFASINPLMHKKEGGVQTYTACLAKWLAGCLGDEEQRCLAAVSVFPGSFTEGGAAAVSGGATGGATGAHDLLRVLRGMSLVRQHVQHADGGRVPTAAKERYSMHALVREAAARMHADQGARDQCLLRFVQWMVQHRQGPGQGLLRSVPAGAAPDTVQRLYLLHEEDPNFAAAGSLLLAGCVDVDASLLDAAGAVALVLSDCGHDLAAKQLHLGAAEVAEQVLGPEHPDMARAKGNLVTTLRRMGELREAKQLEEEVLEARTRVLGLEHPDTLQTKANLAAALYRIGELGQAKRLEEEVLEARTSVLGLEHPDTLHTKGNLASTLYSMGELGGARRLEEEVLEARMVRVPGLEHPDTLHTKGNLAITLHSMGELGAARRLQEEVLEARTRVLGAEHPDTLNTKGNLASTLNSMGELGGARRLEEEVLEARIRVLGPEHPDTLHTKGNLASTLYSMGELGGVRRLEEEVLEACTRMLGPEHPDTLHAKGNLASTLYSMGELGEARRLLEEVLEACTRMLGPEDPAMLHTKGNLASTLDSMGELGVAWRLQEEVLEVRTRVLGPEHPDTLGTKGNLAAMLSGMGELGQARRLEEEVLEARTRVLGPEHPDTLHAKGSLASTLYSMGELGGAKRLEEEVLEARTRVLGPEHADTLLTKANLASTLSGMNELGQARRLQEEVLEVRTRVLGPEHPNTLGTKGNLAAILSGMGELGQARRLEEEVLEARTRVLGPKHPDTLHAKVNLAFTLYSMGKLGGARRLEEEVLEARTRVLGPKHPDTLLTKGNLASTLSGLGELGQARRLQEEVLEVRTRVLGPEHPDALGTKGNLATTLQSMGELGEARRLQEEVLEARTRVLGAEHPDTLRTKGNLASTLNSMGELGEARRLQEKERTPSSPTPAASKPAKTVAPVNPGDQTATPFSRSAPGITAAAGGSSAPSSMSYDVFLSHAGEQKYGVVSHLAACLQVHHPQLRVFVDYQMRGGDGGWEEIQERLKSAKAVVFVLSHAFVRKQCPMKELLLAMNEPKGSQVLVPVLTPCLPYEAAVKLKDAYQAESDWPNKPDDATLEQWAAAVKTLLKTQSARLASKFLVEAALVQQVVADVADQLREAGHYTSRPPALSLPRVVLEFEQRRKAVMDALLEHRVVLLHGMPGVGKSTLAMDITRFAAVHPQLKHLQLQLVRLSHGLSNSSIMDKQKALLRHLAPAAAADFDHPADGRERLQEALAGLEVLLVVDNAWMPQDQPNQLTQLLPDNLLQVLAPGSALLVTSRDARVADAWEGMHTFHVGMLAKEDAKQLFCLHAFRGKHPPVELEMKLPAVLKRCGGLAMALEVMACHLRTNHERHLERWSNWEDNLQRVFKGQAVQGRPDEQQVLFAAFRLSFDMLTHEQQHALLDLALLVPGDLWVDLYACYGEDLNYLAAANFIQCDIRTALTSRWGTAARGGAGHRSGAGVPVLAVHDTVQEFCRSLVEGAGIWGKRLEGGRHAASDILGPDVRGALCTESPAEDYRCHQPHDSPQARILCVKEALLLQPLSSWPCSFPNLLLLELLWPGMAISQPLLQQGTPFADAVKLRVLRLEGTQHDHIQLCLPDSTKLHVVRLRHVDLPLSTITMDMLSGLRHLSLHDACGMDTLRAVALPYLETLQLSECPDLTSIELAASPMPSLSTLHISACTQLQTLDLGPSTLRNLATLQNLCITACPALQTLDLTGCPSLLSIDLQACRGLLTLHTSSLVSLQELRAPHCSALLALNDLSACTALQHLDLAHCYSLGRALGELPASLRHLQLAGCMNLLELPLLHALPSLQHVDISGCSLAPSLDVANCTALTALVGLGRTTASLCRLSIINCPQLVPPSGISMLSSLTALQLEHLPFLAPVQVAPPALVPQAICPAKRIRLADSASCEVLSLTQLTGLQELSLNGAELAPGNLAMLSLANQVPSRWWPGLQLLQIAGKYGIYVQWSSSNGWHTL